MHAHHRSGQNYACVVCVCVCMCVCVCVYSIDSLVRRHGSYVKTIDIAGIEIVGTVEIVEVGGYCRDCRYCRDCGGWQALSRRFAS